MQPDKLHLGCGTMAPADWLNVDASWQVVLARHPAAKRLLRGIGVLTDIQAAVPWSPDVLRADLRRPLPFPDRGFVAVYCSHALEHLYRDEALRLLAECRRVLAPGGLCRFVVPDLLALVRSYVARHEAGDEDASDDFMERLHVHAKSPPRGMRGWYYRISAFHQHKWMYDAPSLKALFRAAGFVDVREARCNESAIPAIEKIEDPERIVGGEGIAVEGTRSGP